MRGMDIIYLFTSTEICRQFSSMYEVRTFYHEQKNRQANRKATFSSSKPVPELPSARPQFRNEHLKSPVLDIKFHRHVGTLNAPLRVSEPCKVAPT